MSKKEDLQALFGVPGVEREFELVQDWTDDGFGVETLIARDKESGVEVKTIRATLEAQAEAAALEQIHCMAREALDEAGLERNADSIIWLTAAHQEAIANS